MRKHNGNFYSQMRRKTVNKKNDFFFLFRVSSCCWLERSRVAMLALGNRISFLNASSHLYKRVCLSEDPEHENFKTRFSRFSLHFSLYLFMSLIFLMSLSPLLSPLSPICLLCLLCVSYISYISHVSYFSYVS